MKKFIALILLIFIGTIGWRVGESLSSDAVSMAIGLLLGVMAGIPTALLVLASDRRQRMYDEHQADRAPQITSIEQHTHYHYHDSDGHARPSRATQVEGGRARQLEEW